MDVRKRRVEACIIDENGNVVKRFSRSYTRGTLEKLAHKRLIKRNRVAFTMTTNA